MPVIRIDDEVFELLKQQAGHKVVTVNQSPNDDNRDVINAVAMIS